MYRNILLSKEAAIVTYQPYHLCRLLQVQRKCNKYFNFKNEFPLESWAKVALAEKTITKCSASFWNFLLFPSMIPEFIRSWRFLKFQTKRDAAIQPSRLWKVRVCCLQMLPPDASVSFCVEAQLISSLTSDTWLGDADNSQRPDGTFHRPEQRFPRAKDHLYTDPPERWSDGKMERKMRRFIGWDKG